MNIFQNKLQLGVAAATVMGVSMVSALPSHAITLVGDDGFSFSGGVVITNGGSDNYDFDFGGNAPENTGPEARVASSTGGFLDADFINTFFVEFADISLPNAGAFSNDPLANFITGIQLDNGDTAVFDILSASFSATPSGQNGQDTFFQFDFDGLVKTSGGETVDALGSITAQVASSFIDENGESSPTTFSGSIRVKRPDEIIPTPAAILPTLLGLGGFAAKRKKNEESQEA